MGEIIHSRAPLRRRARAALPLLLCLCLARSPALSQETWEYSPYKIRVWLALQPAAELTDQLQNQIRQSLVAQARVYAGATWKLAAELAPSALRSPMVAALDRLTAEQVIAAAPDIDSLDKVMLLTVGEEQGDFLIDCRELDCHTRTLGQVVRSRVYELSRVPRDAADTLVRAFSPLVRVEESRGRSATARVRAGGLVIHDYCPSLVQAGDVLRPVIRRNDRRGEPKPGGIQVVDWTYLMVRDQQKYLLDCEVLSAMRNPLAGRNTATVERMALKVRPQGGVTRIRLVSRDDAKVPLEGYEIFAKKPVMKDSEEKNLADRLGLTDWRGTIDVSRDELPLRLLYVKNGIHLIARLPVVPGFEQEQTIELPSDDKRLEAEAFVKGMESTVMDLVARREVLAARIRRRIEEGKLDQARQLLEEIKSFETKDDLETLLTSRQQSGLASTDEREQRRIDQLLSGTRILLNKYLDPDKLVALQREVEEAEKSPRPAGKPVTPEETPAEAEVAAPQ